MDASPELVTAVRREYQLPGIRNRFNAGCSRGARVAATRAVIALVQIPCLESSLRVSQWIVLSSRYWNATAGPVGSIRPARRGPAGAVSRLGEDEGRWNHGTCAAA